MVPKEFSMGTDHTPTPAVHALSAQDRELLQRLRHHRQIRRQARTPELVPTKMEPTRGQRVADMVASTVGSWRFILIQSGIIVLWMGYNLIESGKGWDPYPFILLNLVLSFQAAYTAPAIMMSQNRQAEVDRRQAGNDYEVNVKAELEIELLHQKIDLMREKEIKALTELVRELTQQLDSFKKPGN
jgi:uncharacterized membrane protein